LAGRLRDALKLLDEAAPLVKESNDWLKGRFHLEVANTLKEIGIAENLEFFFERAFDHYREALSHFSHIGNNRYTAIVENNHGYLLSSLKNLRKLAFTSTRPDGYSKC
jgi:hypothetical protein